jgi:hypothetical protein
MSYIKTPIHLSPFTNASYVPMQKLSIDAIGPLPSDELNNRHIIVIIDTCTRYLRLYPDKSTDAESAVMALHQFYADFPVAEQIVSDRGTQFVNDMVKEYNKLCGTDHFKTMAYSKEENAIVERSNKELMRHLRAFIYHKRLKQHWYKYLPFVQRIINTTIHSTTGVSPASLLFGNAFYLDRGIFHDLSHDQIQQLSLSKGAAKMMEAQRILLKIANENQYKKDSENIIRRTPENITIFPPNSYVLIKYPDSGMGSKPPDKLMTYLRGPLRVINNIGPYYTLLNLVTNEQEEAHAKKLKPFLVDKIESILSM